MRPRVTATNLRSLTLTKAHSGKHATHGSVGRRLAASSTATWYRRNAATLVWISGAYYVVGRLSLQVALVETNVTPLWPAAGIALAAFLALGYRAWPAVAVAALLVNVAMSGSSLAALAIAGGNTVAPLIGAYWLDRMGFDWDRGSRNDAQLIIAASLAAMTISASTGSLALLSTGVIERSDLLGTWTVWWAGDTMGALTVAPVLWSAPLYRQLVARGRQTMEAVGLSVLLVVVCALAVRSPSPRLYAVVPIVSLMAWRLERLGAATAALISVSIVAWASANDVGAFGISDLTSDMLTLQGFTVVIALCSFFFAAVVGEQRAAAAALSRSGEQLQERVTRATAALEVTNASLAQEVRERTIAQDIARHQATELAEAQAVAHIGSWSWEVGGDRVMWSDELYRIYGVDSDGFAATYRAFLELVHPGDRDRVSERVSSAVTSGGVFEFEHRIVRPNGEIRDVFSHGQSTVDSEGRTVRLVGTAQDITERKRAEGMLRVEDERRRLQEIFVKAPAAVVLTRGPDHVIDFANPSFFEVLGTRDCIGKRVIDAFPDIEEQGYFELLSHVYATGETYSAVEAPLLIDRHHTGVREEVFFNFTYQPVRDLQGEVEGIFGHGVDVTDMVRARQQVEDMAAQMGRLYEQELHVTEVLQRSLLPERLPEIAGLELVGRYAPGSAEAEVGGDWYDALALPDGRLVMMIGDVEGHGIEAAATMGQLRNALRAYLVEGAGPAQAVRRLRKLVQDTGNEHFATVLCLSLRPDTLEACIASAGHLPPLLVRSGGECEFLRTVTAAPIGAPIGSDPSELVLQLPPGSKLVLYTDGLVERRGAGIDDGLALLTDLARTCPSGLEPFADRLLERLGHDRSDDIALLVLGVADTEVPEAPLQR